MNTHQTRSNAAERQRRRYRRRCAGLAVLRIEVDELQALEALRNAGFLDGADAGGHALEAALQRAISAWFDAHA